MWWGYSKALDLLEEDSSKDETDGCEGTGETDGCKGTDETTHNILLVGQCDCRHVLKTIAQRYRHKKCDNVNFYIYEPLLENVARQLLFLTVALEPTELIGISEKTLFFLELYGNTLLRPATDNYLIKISKRLLNVITNFNYAHEILPSISLERLKYRERDQLEVIFKYWAEKKKTFDILAAWDERLRKHLGTRYDSKSGVFDWDYHMRYRCFGADVLNLQEYKRFRERGISFYFDDTDPCIPNLTLTSAIFSYGSKILSYGYLGDIVTGPYVTFGLDCEDEQMLKKVNGIMKKTATHITERNIMRIFHEIEHQTPFVPLSEDESQCTLASFKDESCNLKVNTDSTNDSGSPKVKMTDSLIVYESLSTHNCRIIFLPTSELCDLTKKTEYNCLFDQAFITQSMIFKHIKPDFFNMLKPNAKVIVDTPKFSLSYRLEDLEEFKKKLEALMADFHCKLTQDYNYEKDEVAKFIVQK